MFGLDIATVFYLVSTAVTTGIAVYSFFKSKNYKQAWQATSRGMLGMTAALELLPSTDPRVQQVKNTMRSVAEGIGSQSETLATMVDSVEALLQEHNFNKTLDETSPEQIERAVEALKAYQAKKGLVK